MICLGLVIEAMFVIKLITLSTKEISQKRKSMCIDRMANCQFHFCKFWIPRALGPASSRPFPAWWQMAGVVRFARESSIPWSPGLEIYHRKSIFLGSSSRELHQEELSRFFQEAILPSCTQGSEEKMKCAPVPYPSLRTCPSEMHENRTGSHLTFCQHKPWPDLLCFNSYI